MKKLYGSRVRKSSGLTSALSDKIKPYGIVRKVSKFTDKAEIQLESLKNEVKQPLEQLVDKGVFLFLCYYFSFLSPNNEIFLLNFFVLYC